MPIINIWPQISPLQSITMAWLQEGLGGFCVIVMGSLYIDVEDKWIILRSALEDWS